MRVLIVNTSEKTGGAAVASLRLMDALNNNGVKAMMLVRDKETSRITVTSLPRSPLLRWHFLWERWCVFWHLHFSRRHLFEVDIANAGSDITSLPEFKDADIIHLAWINQGMLSLRSIGRIIASGKPVVWTMHDVWPATGVCHYTRGCSAFKAGCRRCRLLPGGGSDHDLAHRVYLRKQKVYAESGIHLVTCSQWLGTQARQSGLLRGLDVSVIPNPIDTRVFCKQDKRQARQAVGLPEDRRLILFVSQRVTDERKGMAYFVEALNRLVADHPEMKADTGVVILGGHADKINAQLPLPAYPLGYVSDERQIVRIYNAADLFVLPSLEDNLPNTIMEAMACGVPCAGFRVGGIPEEIDHRTNGYVAEYKDAGDLARGMHWILREADYDALSRAAVSKVTAVYAQRSVAMKYIDVYNRVMAQKNEHL